MMISGSELGDLFFTVDFRWKCRKLYVKLLLNGQCIIVGHNRIHQIVLKSLQWVQVGLKAEELPSQKRFFLFYWFMWIGAIWKLLATGQRTFLGHFNEHLLTYFSFTYWHNIWRFSSLSLSPPLRDLCSELADDVDDGSDLPLLESMTRLRRYVAVL